MRLNTYKAALCCSLLCFLSTAALAQSKNRAQLMSEIEALHNQIKVKETELLTPSAEDRTAFADFLKEPDTGLIRLLPRETFQDKLTIRGGGAYYSFARLAHEYGHSDIELQMGTFQSGFAGANYGLLLMLGDVPLETVNLETAGVPFLAKYIPPSKEAEARQQKRQLHEGINANGLTYKDKLPVLVERTYILRSIDYSFSDTLVAFRVIRQDSDGSLILLWKLLKKFPATQLIPKDEG
jgi:hypothetical protein